MGILWRNNRHVWGIISVVVHWLSAVCIFGLFGLGFWMVDLSYYSEWYRTAPFIHKSLGILLFFMTFFRLLWRLRWDSPAPLPTHRYFEQLGAHLVHIVLYILLFGVMVSGYLISTADGRSISVFGLFEIPAIITSLPRQEDIAGFIHYYLSYILIMLVFVHGLGALKHHIMDKDATLRRMFGRH